MLIATYILMGIVGLFFIIPAVMPGKYNVEKSIVINKTPDVVFNHVADLNHYRDWNPWQKMEPGAKANISGTPKTVGHKFDWEGKKIGTGSLTIRSLNPPHKAEIDLEFIKPWAAKADDNWTFEDLKNGSTKVTWNNQGGLKYPMARLMGPMINKNLNQQFEQGLKSLKEMCEK
jgi:ribosome-associated toxin RatA of RatAB toxin-antitoxin module